MVKMLQYTPLYSNCATNNIQKTKVSKSAKNATKLSVIAGIATATATATTNYKKPNKIISILKNLGKSLINIFKSNKHEFTNKNIIKNFNTSLSSMSTNLKTKIGNKILEYLESRKGKDIDPAELDKILRKMAGKNNTIELNFYESPQIGVTAGRKIAYRFKDGNEIIELHLECHTGRNGTTTRLYTAQKNGERIEKPDRSYLFPNGGFGEDAYNSGLAHLPSGELGKAWIDAAQKFNKVA